jgi:PleD family two-component response regulator
MALQDLAGVDILVVEDTDDSREMLRMALEYCGALVTTAASAEEAKRILDSIRPRSGGTRPGPVPSCAAAGHHSEQGHR